MGDGRHGRLGQSSGQDCGGVQQSDLIMSDIMMVERRWWVTVDMGLGE